MVEHVAIAGPVVGDGAVSRRRPSLRRQRLGTGLHLDCSRTYISKLEAEGVIQRQGDGFPARPEPRWLPLVLTAQQSPCS
jgi:hypothetical protein